MARYVLPDTLPLPRQVMNNHLAHSSVVSSADLGGGPSLLKTHVLSRLQVALSSCSFCAKVLVSLISRHLNQDLNMSCEEHFSRKLYRGGLMRKLWIWDTNHDDLLQQNHNECWLLQRHLLKEIYVQIRFKLIATYELTLYIKILH